MSRIIELTVADGTKLRVRSDRVSAIEETGEDAGGCVIYCGSDSARWMVKESLEQVCILLSAYDTQWMRPLTVGGINEDYLKQLNKQKGVER